MTDLEKCDAIERETNKKVKELLRLVVTYKLYDRYISQAQTKWREVEAELSIDYDLQGVGIELNRNEISDRAIVKDFIVDPGEIVEQIGSFPLAAAVASYAFNQLDAYGNFVAYTLGKGEEFPPVAWHNPIHVRISKDDKTAYESARKKFANVFGLEVNDIPDAVLDSLVDCKRRRNYYIHQGAPIRDLRNFVEGIVRVMCGVAFACCDGLNSIKVFPYTRYDE